MWSLDFDGRFVGRRARSEIIPHFEGERAITELKVFPCDYYDRRDDGKLRRRLEQHGKQWYESLVGRQVYYSGRLVGSKNKTYQGRAYIDSVSYYSEYWPVAPELSDIIEDMGKGLPRCYCVECHGQRPHPRTGFRWEAYDVLDPFKDRDLETDGSKERPRHRYLLCSGHLWGLMFKTRTWAKLDVANCSYPRANTRAIENLVMPERKTMIKALVQRYANDGTKPKSSQQPWLADHMESKGEGQIFLLHGGPGVGKTFVKCIAEFTGRALLSLTAGDIGTDETKVEENLVKWFRLAENWGAVMLIDEADVYLEKREFADLKRNSLVSAFLRCTEYYRGILFLTTNRVGKFDDAFISRIHIVIAYENLSPSDKATIWKQFFNKLSEDRQDMTVTARARKYVLDENNPIDLGWNGREIRNVALAEYRFQQKRDKADDDGPVLDERDFAEVLDMTSKFKDYLANVHGATVDERAHNEKSRANY
ncbi:P-loop containing nucleoside triphosphate hydrolase protein [Astrocystis sublimbata]|nr:P-loop containing nucleoside triphosphate hydrolase protein [Astrocystis sublimbata]